MSALLSEELLLLNLDFALTNEELEEELLLLVLEEEFLLLVLGSPFLGLGDGACSLDLPLPLICLA